jgi:hypothetical protein
VPFLETPGHFQAMTTPIRQFYSSLVPVQVNGA